MSRRGERAVVAELLRSDPAPFELDFRAGAGQGMGRVDRPVDPGVAGDDVAAAVPVPALAVVWCCSVGATWTVELHEFDRGAALGTIAYWISSGVPISEPQPKTALAHELLTERGFQLFPDSSAGPSCPHRHAGPRIRPALPRAGGYPRTGTSRPLRPARPAHGSRRSDQQLAAQDTAFSGHDY
ncbi:MAG: hypothetical protein ACRDRA_21730 [Pseudonocardiaceae bacterium]